MISPERGSRWPRKPGAISTLAAVTAGTGTGSATKRSAGSDVVYVMRNIAPHLGSVFGAASLGLEALELMESENLDTEPSPFQTTPGPAPTCNLMPLLPGS